MAKFLETPSRILPFVFAIMISCLWIEISTELARAPTVGGLYWEGLLHCTAPHCYCTEPHQLQFGKTGQKSVSRAVLLQGRILLVLVSILVHFVYLEKRHFSR